MSDNLENFKKFIERRIKASDAYVKGDAGPLIEISAAELPATFFGPGGDYVEGAKKVGDRYESDAGSFVSASENTFETLQMAADEDIAYWVGLQHSTVRMKGKDEEIPMILRVTEIFSREGEAWKMVHRHADFFKPSDKDQKPVKH